jgi:hypothetical protein
MHRSNVRNQQGIEQMRHGGKGAVAQNFSRKVRQGLRRFRDFKGALESPKR